MHEFTVTKAILSLVLQKAREVKTARITQIELQVGRLTGFIPESIQLQFALLSKDTAADGASLVFQQSPAKLHCRRCNADFTTDSCEIVCPDCHTLEVDIISGMELNVVSMEAE